MGAQPKEPGSSRGSRTGDEVGLCRTCRHARTVRNPRGSVFWLCERSRTDPDFPRYPHLPVLRCVGYEGAESADAG